MVPYGIYRKGIKLRAVVFVRQKGLISIESQLGKQLLGHKVGDHVTIKVSDEFSYGITITKIENTGLTEDDKIRDFLFYLSCL